MPVGNVRINLINATTNEIVAEILPDQAYDLGDLLDGDAFTVSVDYLGPEPVGSVRLEMSGPGGNFARTENGAPYTLFGDGGSAAAPIYAGQVPPANGTYSFSTTVFDGPGGTGAILEQQSFDFSTSGVVFGGGGGGSGEGDLYLGQDGLLVVEVEDLGPDPLSDWVFRDDAIEQTGATGSGFYEWDTGLVGVSGPDIDDALSYSFQVDEDGWYDLTIRARRPGVAPESDLENDVWVRMIDANGALVTMIDQDGSEFFRDFTKLAFPGGNRQTWLWAQNLEFDRDGETVHPDAVFDLRAGQTYTIQFAGRSTQFQMDRFHLNNGVDNTDATEAPSPKGDSIDPDNDAPTAVNDTARVDEDDTVTITVLSNDSDPNGDDLEVLSASATNGTVSVNGAEQLVYTPDDDFNGQAIITYTIFDGRGGSDQAQVTVTVDPQNDAPTVGTLTDLAATAGIALVPVNLSIAFDDVDIEDGDSLDFFAAGLPAGLSLSETGVLSGTPGTTGTFTVTVTAEDEAGETVTATTTITVAVGDQTVLSLVGPDDPVPEDQDITFTVNRIGDTSEALTVPFEVAGSGTSPASDRDFDDAFPGTSSVTFAAGQSTTTFTIAVRNEFEFEDDEEFTVTLDPGGTLQDVIISQGTVQAVIANEDLPNPPPTAQADIIVGALGGGAVGGNVLADNRNGRDFDPLGESLAVTAVNGQPLSGFISLPSGAIITMLADGNFTYNPLSAFAGPGNGSVVEDSFTYTLVDEADNTETATVTLRLTSAPSKGTDGDDLVGGTAGRDKLSGRDGDDELVGGDGDDRTKGGDGNDVHYGGAGDDRLRDKDGNDELYGGEGDDRLRAGDGDDILSGGLGEDELRGDDGIDTFIFTGGTDIIRDFEPGVDKIDVSAFAGLDFDTLIAGAQEEKKFLILTVDAGEQIWLRKTDISDLSEGDFIFA